MPVIEHVDLYVRSDRVPQRARLHHSAIRLARPANRACTRGDASPSISSVLERAAITKTEEVVTGLEWIRQG